MRLTNFNIDNDNTGLNYNGVYLDLHNNFDFRAFNYDVSSRQLELTWTRSHEDWANEKIPSFKLVFRGVQFLKIQERDNSLPSSEDTCLSIIGFLPSDLRDNFNGYVEQKNAKETDDLNILFQSDQAFKISCTYADFVELNEEIIYVLITNEAVDVWRPMWADRIEETVYRIKSFSNYDPTDEELQFKSGEIVVCEKQTKSEGQVLVAISKR
jgi:hypothetical protein